jgi:hypothetical protein
MTILKTQNFQAFEQIITLHPIIFSICDICQNDKHPKADWALTNYMFVENN